MKNMWTLFVAGVFSVAVVSLFLRNTQAQSDDARVKNIEDASISGLKTPVPGKSEMEAALVDKEKQLKEKERQIAESEERLKVEEARLKLRISELEKIQDELAKKTSENKAVADSIMKKMVKTFETMAPKKAAGILMIMSDQLAVDLLMNMKEKKVAQVMDVMEPNRAMVLSSAIASRKPAANVKAEEQARP